MTTSRPMVVVLTRDGSRYGLQLLEALARAEVAADAVVVARESISRRWRLLRSVARRIGWVDALAAAVLAMRERGPALASLTYEDLCPRVLRVTSFHDPAAREVIGALDADWFLLGQTGILNPALLSCARGGVLNAHPGWLPDYRGLQPALWALADGRPEKLGSTLHLVDAGIDTGAIVRRRALDRVDLPAFEALETRLYEDCVALLVEAAVHIRAGRAPAGAQQPHGAGRYCSVAPRDVRRRARICYEACRRAPGPTPAP